MNVAVANAIIEELRDAGLSRETRGLELPEVQVVGPWKTTRPTRKAMLGHRFYVYGAATRLRPPIDWLQDPHQSRTWRYELHTLAWLKEALARHAASSDVESLTVARDVVLDWVRSHFRSEGEQSEFAWYDMAVGLRAPYLGYVLRACLMEEMLADEDAELLLEAAERHGTALAQGGSYAVGHNHGLFQDEGLYLLARQLPTLPAAEAWRELALIRMKATLAATVSFEDGAHLEHSPAYQLAIVDLVARLAGNVTELPELGGLLNRLRRTAAWQVTPAGRMAQLGDTDDLRAPAWARDAASSLRGATAFFESGQAFVRDRSSYLAVSAAHHGSAHKHADDTGFLLVEGGAVLIGDAGRWGYYEDEPDRLYARSAAAHNVLTVDGRDFDWRRAKPYGSALEAIGEEDGWYAIVVGNPLLAMQGVDHRRALLYRPGEALMVLDEVRSAEQHEYVRRFHFGPDLTVEKDGKGRIAIAGDNVAATLTDLADQTEITLERGHDGVRSGWVYPGDRERKPVWTAALRHRTDSTTFVAVITLGGKPMEVSGTTLEPGRVEIDFDSAPTLALRLDRRSGRSKARPKEAPRGGAVAG